MVLNFILVFVVSLSVAWFSIPYIIKVSEIKHLFDEPSEDRKIHVKRTPNLGGMAIFASFFFTTLFFVPGETFRYLNYLLCALLILFVVGLKDDLVGLSPSKKFIAQIAAAFIIAYFGDIRITGLHGVFGIHTINFWVSIGFSLFLIILIVNAFNLIDGIDGLAGIIGFIVFTIYAVGFYMMGYTSLSLISVALMGSILGFLRYNLSPAKIFMGDTGSLLIGLIAAALTIKFVDLNRPIYTAVTDGLHIQAAPVVAISILIIPLFDTLRVFSIRALSGKSPFTADRNHLHHKLLDRGYGHTQAALILAAINFLFIAVIFFAKDFGMTFSLIVLAVMIVLLWTAFTLIGRNNDSKE